jgi:hypothetical protein
LWTVTAGSAQVTTTPGSVACQDAPVGSAGVFGRCTQGTAAVRFDVTVSGVPVRTPPAPRTLVAATTTIPAVVWQVDSVRVPTPVPPPGGTRPGAPPTPPVPVMPLAPVVSRLEVLTATRDSVRVRFTLRALQPTVLDFPTAQRVEVEALGGGAVAWRWSTGQFFTLAAVRDSLAPGAERRYEATWRQPTRGGWVLRARTVNTGGPVTESVAPVVVP